MCGAQLKRDRITLEEACKPAIRELETSENLSLIISLNTITRKELLVYCFSVFVKLISIRD